MDIRSFFQKPSQNGKNGGSNKKQSAKELNSKKRTKSNDSEPSAKQHAVPAKSPNKKAKIGPSTTPTAFFSSEETKVQEKSSSLSRKREPATSSPKPGLVKTEAKKRHVETNKGNTIAIEKEVKAPVSRLQKSGSVQHTNKAPTSRAQTSAPTQHKVPVKIESPVHSNNSSTESNPPSSLNEIPTGKPLCLTGKAFAVTGLPQVCSSREDLEDLIRQYGGTLKQAISSRVHFLVAAGEQLEDGRKVSESRKYRGAKERGIPILNESDLFKMIATLPTPRDAVVVAPPQAASSSSQKSKGKGNRKASHSSAVLWADKYKPKGPQDVIGNPGPVRNFQSWLRDFDLVHVRKVKKPPPYNKSNPGAKAVLISGPPGIGKSSSVAAIGKSLGYDIYELNASDARSKKLVHSQLSSVVGSSDLNFAENEYGKAPKRLIIMDEVDGMSSQDRGGMQELIKVIKVSKTPIVCICNDRMKSSVRSLANHCFDLRFNRPDKGTVGKRLMKIAQQEGMQVEPQALEFAIQSTGSDIRQVLNLLQMWKATSNTMTFTQMKDRVDGTKKDPVLRLSHFDACKFIFNLGHLPGHFNRAFDAYFTDIDMLPLMIGEQYVTSARRRPIPGMKGDLELLERLSRASDAVSDMDQVGLKIRSNQLWELLPLQSALGVRVAAITKGGISQTRFPEWLGKNSTRTKKHRLLGELSMHLRQSASCSRTSVSTDYVPMFKRVALKLMDPKQSPNGPSELIDFMDEYGLSRDDVFETLPELQYSSLPNHFDKIPSQQKSKFTRAYNARAHKSQALVHEDPVKTKGKAKKKKKKAVDLALTAEDGGVQNDEDESQDSDADSVAELMASGKSSSRAKAGGKKASRKGNKKRKG